MSYRMMGAFVLSALGIVSAAVVANAPDTLPYLWEIKAATVSFTGVAGLLIHFFDKPAG
jgi:hypothetical protein